MDKYEYNLKLDQMKSRYAEEKYDEAADIADTINWNKVKNVNGLVKAGEVYEKVQRYEDSREVLLMAYDRSPIGRMIIYRLAEVSIKMQDFQGAQEYYDEFVDIAPHDTLKYVLRYNLKKAQGASNEELIPILEELKEQEYTEEWAYELAYLYHKAGMSEKCIDACDELVLWFGDGPYVERALELKMLYQPLSKTQEEKYRGFQQARDDRSGLTHINVDEMARAGEIAHDPVAIPKVEVNTERFNTVNLQAEIAKGMQQIINATEKETVTDTMDSINRMVEDVPFLKMQMEEEKPSEENRKSAQHIETDAEIDGALKNNFKELLGEDYDGQMRMMTHNKDAIEHQITGQMSISEVLDEWEKTRRAAEVALEEANKRKLASAKARALQEAGDIMDRLTGVLPKLDEVIAEKANIVQETETQAGPQQQEMTEEPKEPAEKDAPEPEELWPEGVSLEEMVKAQKEKREKRKKKEPEIETSDTTEEKQDLKEDRGVEEMETNTELNTKPKKDFEEVAMEELPEKPTLAQEREEEFAFVRKRHERPGAKGKTTRMPLVETPVDLAGEEAQTLPLMELTDAQKAIFSYFMPVKGMEDQLCRALTVAASHLKKDEAAGTGNLVIKGGQGSGKTTLATSVIKVLQEETGVLDGKIGKIHAEALNHKDVSTLLSQVSGGCLIIEQAGDMEQKTVAALSQYLDQDFSGLFVILEDTSRGIKRLFAQNEAFSAKFSEQISVPIFTNDELVTFARSYSRELGYKIDDMAVLALYNRISNIQRLDQATTLTEVKDIVDEAIHREAHGGLKKAISILTAKRYTDDDRIVLTEKDFE